MSAENEELLRWRQEVKRLRMEREILKKARPSLPKSRVEIRLHSRPPADLAGRSGFYDYQRRQSAPARSGEENALLERSKAIAAKTHHRDGRRRLAKQLQEERYEIGRFKMRQLMKQAGVSAAGRCCRRPHTTDSRHGYAVAPNLLERHCDVGAPNVAWCGDITYIWTEEGWLYTAVLLDLYSRKVVEWAMSNHVDTQLVRDALEMALGRRQPGAGLIHHSDRGAQYARQTSRSLLAEHGIACSMVAKGSV